jgi:PDZ domain
LQEIHGSYKLQPQHCLTNPTPPTLATTMGETSHSSVDDIVNLDDAAIASAGLLGGGFSSGSVNAGSSDQISLSKKAIHQRDADENLFLRFLELDPPDEEVSVSPAPTVVAPLNASPIPSSYSQQSRRMSSYAKSAPGRTPFTITKKLTRTLEKGFGFSIVWTHPPRIEKIEHGLSAEKAGILPGDYVIFVDKHNVVTMPEIDILNLIKTQGNTLVLEIFRRPGKQPTNGLMRTNSREAGATKLLHLAGNLNMPNLLNNNTSSNNFNNNNININNSISNVANHSSELRFDDDALKPLLAHPRSSTACSNASIETSKRRLNLPQVTFSKEVGQGVIV